MLKWKLNKFLVAILALAILVPERDCEIGSVGSTQHQHQGNAWDRFGVATPPVGQAVTYSENVGVDPLHTSGTQYYTVVNQSEPEIEFREVPRSNNYYQDYDIFPSSYRRGKRNGKKCTYSGGRIKCLSRRDSSYGGGGGGGDYGGGKGMDSYAAAAILGSPSTFRYEIQPDIGGGGGGGKGGGGGGGWGEPVVMKGWGEPIMSGGGWGEEEEEDEGGKEKLKDLLPLLGLLGLKGLLPSIKGAKGFIASLPFLLPLLPILIPLALPLLLPLLLPLILGAALPLLLPLLLLFIPIPVVVTPGTGRAREFSLSGNNGTMSISNINVTQMSQMMMQRMELMNGVMSEAFQSEDCIKRMSCEFAKAAETRFNVSEPFIEKLVNRLPVKAPFIKYIKQGMGHYGESSRKKDKESPGPKMDPCSKFTCTPLAKLYA